MATQDADQENIWTSFTIYVIWKFRKAQLTNTKSSTTVNQTNVWLTVVEDLVFVVLVFCEQLKDNKKIENA